MARKKSTAGLRSPQLPKRGGSPRRAARAGLHRLETDLKKVAGMVTAPLRGLLK